MFARVCSILILAISMSFPTFADSLEYLFNINEQVLNFSEQSESDIQLFFKTFEYDYFKWRKLKSDEYGWECYDMVKALKENKGVCLDGALLFSSAMELKGYESSIIMYYVGTEGHAISRFKKDGVYLYFDTVRGDFVEQPNEAYVYYVLEVPDEKIKDVRVLYDKLEVENVLM